MIRRSWISLRQTWGASLFLLSFGCDGSRYYRVVHGTALIPNKTQFPCRTLAACLQKQQQQEKSMSGSEGVFRVNGSLVLRGSRPTLWDGGCPGTSCAILIIKVSMDLPHVSGASAMPRQSGTQFLPRSVCILMCSVRLMRRSVVMTADKGSKGAREDPRAEGGRGGKPTTVSSQCHCSVPRAVSEVAY